MIKHNLKVILAENNIRVSKLTIQVSLELQFQHYVRTTLKVFNLIRWISYADI